MNQKLIVLAVLSFLIPSILFVIGILKLKKDNVLVEKEIENIKEFMKELIKSITIFGILDSLFVGFLIWAVIGTMNNDYYTPPTFYIIFSLLLAFINLIVIVYTDINKKDENYLTDEELKEIFENPKEDDSNEIL